MNYVLPKILVQDMENEITSWVPLHETNKQRQQVIVSLCTHSDANTRGSKKGTF